MSDPQLFGGYPDDETGALSADRRRTLRQHAQIHAGIHPLTGGVLHPLASRDRDSMSPRTDPFTCGTCIHRVTGYGYPKCDVGNGQRITRGPGTDVRAWWPACPAYTAKPPKEST